jgi:uncharacterized protein (DUF4415 family)
MPSRADYKRLLDATSRSAGASAGKQLISLRLDRDVLDWFKQQGKGYQTRINAILRAYIRAHAR